MRLHCQLCRYSNQVRSLSGNKVVLCGQMMFWMMTVFRPAPPSGQFGVLQAFRPRPLLLQATPPTPHCASTGTASLVWEQPKYKWLNDLEFVKSRNKTPSLFLYTAMLMFPLCPPLCLLHHPDKNERSERREGEHQLSCRYGVTDSDKKVFIILKVVSSLLVNF